MSILLHCKAWEMSFSIILFFFFSSLFLCNVNVDMYVYGNGSDAAENS